MFDTLASQIGAVFVVLACAFAFLKGDEPERIAGGAYILGWFASMLLQDGSESSLSLWGLAGVDIVMLLVFGGLAWRSRRAWPVWAAALQMLIVMGHFVLLLYQGPTFAAFIIANNLASYGVLVALAIGTFWAWQERRAAGLE